MVRVVAGWQPIMPTYQGQVTEEQLTQLISYVQSLSGEGGTEAGGGTAEVGTAGSQATAPPPQSGPQPQ
jgi:cytochrome c oxidase subunit 2